MTGDISTFALAELTSAATNNKVSSDEIMKLWYAIGKFIMSQLQGKKGVKMSGFGVFTLSPTFTPVFTATNDFLSQYKLRQSSSATSSNIPTMLLNFAYLAQTCDIEREKAEKVFTKFISCLGRAVGEGRMISLTINKVSEIRIGRGEIVCDFMRECLDCFQSSSTSRPSLKTTASKTLTQLRATSQLRPRSASSQSNTMRPNSRATTPTLTRRNSTNHALTSSNIVRHQMSQFDIISQQPREVAARAINNSNSTSTIIDKVRAKIVERGGSGGIRTISRLLMIMDDNGDKKLSKEELKFGLRDYGIELNPSELEQVFQYFDRDRNGFIDITEFLIGLRGDMNNRRKSMIRMAFDILDIDRSGIISTEEVMNKYDFTQDPDVRSGKKTIQQAAKEFMLHWERGSIDGEITYDEFEDYYKDISASIDDDDYFELMIRNAWRIAGGSGMAANTANRRLLVTKADGSQSVETVENELGLRGKDVDGMRARLKQQGIDAAKIDLYGYQDNTSQPKQQRGGIARPTLSSSSQPRQQLQPQPPVSNNRNMAPRPPGRNNQPSTSNQIFPPQPPQSAVSTSASSATSSTNVMSVLHRLLYSPPVPLEQLCNKLQVSLAANAPRMAMGAFKSRISSLDGSLDRNTVNEIWRMIDPSNSGSVEVTKLYEMLAERFGKDKATNKSSSNVIERAKAKVLERCGGQAGIKGLTRVLSIMDNNGDKRLTKEELKYGLQDYGIELNIRELEELFSFFDRDRNGYVDITEFLVGMRGELNERRRHFVQLAFNTLDRDRSGYITIDEIAAVYDVSANPEVISGKKTKDQAFKDFMSQWDRGDRDGIVSYDEFEDYYKEISASIDGDDYFELMMRNAWRIAGGSGMAANTANRRLLVTKADGSQSVETVENELGLRGKDVDGMRARLKQQGIDAAKIDLYGYQDNTSQPKQQQQNRFNSTSSSHQQTSNDNGMPQRKTYDRHMAAMKVAAVYRGKLARNKVEYEKKKVDAVRRQQKEDDIEANRPKPRQILRPKGKSYIGF